MFEAEDRALPLAVHCFFTVDLIFHKLSRDETFGELRCHRLASRFVSPSLRLDSIVAFGPASSQPSGDMMAESAPVSLLFLRPACKGRFPWLVSAPAPSFLMKGCLL